MESFKLTRSCVRDEKMQERFIDLGIYRFFIDHSLVINGNFLHLKVYKWLTFARDSGVTGIPHFLK